ncbi:related to alpha-1,2-galactosyltransferase [Rhynchosporium graminicola]|uniref:Related to alpha-1,2-galactosyltransferase n=1 Tax=Rhynchosporium graminicola TaxID=2792576 RepID=A0A1E1JQK1_9HELO|nr:related to alpha-1,2-galactosyltransferase [Rhynchosporium commune]
MHMALPMRKSSNPPPYANRSTRLPMLRRSRVQAILLVTCAVGAVIYILSQVFGGERIPSGTPPVVIVTILSPDLYSKEYINNIKDNRIEYARKHGYTTFFPIIKDYDLGNSPSSWSRVPAVRHALTKFPHSTYIWYLDQNSLIMNPDKTVEGEVMNPKKLESIMIRDQPVVPPDSVIKTFSHLKGANIEFVLTQDKEGLSPGSFIIRNGDWAKFFLDTWMDPLYRSYNFQKAETHALEHIVQWHPTILSKMALVPQRALNAYSKQEHASAAGTYKDGDFVIRFVGCDASGRSCEGEAEPFSKQWKTAFRLR